MFIKVRLNLKKIQRYKCIEVIYLYKCYIHLAVESAKGYLEVQSLVFHPQEIDL